MYALSELFAEWPSQAFPHPSPWYYTLSLFNAEPFEIPPAIRASLSQVQLHLLVLNVRRAPWVPRSSTWGAWPPVYCKEKAQGELAHSLVGCAVCTLKQIVKLHTATYCTQGRAIVVAHTSSPYKETGWAKLHLTASVTQCTVHTVIAITNPILEGCTGNSSSKSTCVIYYYTICPTPQHCALKASGACGKVTQ